MKDGGPLVLITRPRTASERFGKALRARRHVDTLIAPVLEIEPLEEQVSTEAFTAAIFTSAHGAALSAGQSGQTAYCVGRATAVAARESGYEAVSADGDAGDLVQTILSDAPSGKLVHVRGADTTGNVAQQLNAAGIDTREIVAYRQVDREIPANERTAIAGASRIVAPVFSPRSARRLSRELGVRSRLTVVAISPAAAEAWSGEADAVLTARAPTLPAMVDAVLAALDSDSHCSA